MKSLHVLFLLSLFAFQVFLFASTPAQGYLTGSTLKVMSLRPPTHPPRRHSPPPPTPSYSPEPGPGRTQRSPPTPFIVAPAATNSLLHKGSASASASA